MIKVVIQLEGGERLVTAVPDEKAGLISGAWERARLRKGHLSFTSPGGKTTHVAEHIIRIIEVGEDD